MTGQQEWGVGEFQGFYAPFTVSERLLQKIWLRGDYDGGKARTLDGRRVEILFPGKWNLLEGPDFKDARIRIGGREMTGDIELHFHAADWARHNHHLDRAYNRVILHVLLFQPGPREMEAVTESGQAPPAMTLLELLHHDLEEYATEEALEVTLERSHWQATEELLALAPDERKALLGRHARTRWERKVRYLMLRVEKLGWTEACHQTVMEILGYRRNRGAMITVATRYPLSGWRRRMPDEEEMLAAGFWVAQGSRPANHPRQRLRQYLRWVENRPDWPERLQTVFTAAALESGERNTDTNTNEFAAGRFRAARSLNVLRREWAREITGDAVGGTRLHTLFCDGFFPLAAAGSSGVCDLFPYWFAWYAGDFPDRVTGTLRTTDVTDRREFVACNGFCQGVISLSLEKRSDPLVCFEKSGPAHGYGD